MSSGATYLMVCEDLLVTSMGNGSVQQVVLSPPKSWNLGLNLAEIVAGLRIKSLTTNTGIKVRWQYSLDGKTWVQGGDIGAERTADGDYVASLTTVLEMLPWCRIVIETRNTVDGVPKSGLVSVWAYYKYRS